jgi:hypothetical protein
LFVFPSHTFNNNNNIGFIVDKDDFFHVPYLFEWAPFFATGALLSQVPTILHVAVIFALNSVYSKIAELLTDNENHRTEHDYRNSLIAKRFLFEGCWNV